MASGLTTFRARERHAAAREAGRASRSELREVEMAPAPTPALQMRDGMTIDATSHLAWIDGIEQLVVATAREAGLDEDGAYFLGIALREALVNAIRHGHGFDTQRRVKVHVRIATGRVMVITVRDRGAGFDPTALPDPLAEENLTRPSGRGILFMRQFADRVSFSFPRSGGSLVRLEKDLPERAA